MYIQNNQTKVFKENYKRQLIRGHKKNGNPFKLINQNFNKT